jgi:hypothetical protein
VMVSSISQSPIDKRIELTRGMSLTGNVSNQI